MTPEAAIQKSIDHWVSLCSITIPSSPPYQEAQEAIGVLGALLQDAKSLDFDPVLKAETLFNALAAMNGKHANMVITTTSKAEIKEDTKVVARKIAITVTEPYAKPS